MERNLYSTLTLFWFYLSPNTFNITKALLFIVQVTYTLLLSGCYSFAIFFYKEITFEHKSAGFFPHLNNNMLSSLFHKAFSFNFYT